MDKLTKLRLRAPVVLTRTWCDLARMMEAVRTRTYKQLTMNEAQRDIAIFAVKDRRNSIGFTFAIIEMNEIYESILEACEGETTLVQLLEYVTAHLAQQGKQRPHLEQLCLRAVDRLVGLQAICANEAGDSLMEAQTQGALRPTLIRLNPFTVPLYNLQYAPFSEKQLSVSNSVQFVAEL